MIRDDGYPREADNKGPPPMRARRRRRGALRPAARVGPCVCGGQRGVVRRRVRLAVKWRVLSTSGKLVFQGQETGELAATLRDPGEKTLVPPDQVSIDTIPGYVSAYGEHG